MFSLFAIAAGSNVVTGLVMSITSVPPRCGPPLAVAAAPPAPLVPLVPFEHAARQETNNPALAVSAIAVTRWRQGLGLFIAICLPLL